MTQKQVFLKAITLHEEGKLKDAEYLYRDLLQDDPNNPEVNHNLGVLLYKLKRFDEAKTFFKITIQYKPDYITAHFNLGSIWQKLHKLDEAELSFKKTIELKPDYFQAYNNLAAIQIEQGRLDKAHQNLKKTIELNPNFVQAHNNLGVVLQKLGKFDEAEISYKKTIELNPNLTDVYNNLGSTYNKLGRFYEAETSFKKGILMKPDLAESHYNLGITLYELNRFNDAEKSYKKAITLKPNYADAHNNLGIILQKLCRFDEAEISFKKAIEIKPDYSGAFNNLGNLQNVSGKLDEAEISYKKAIELKPDYAQAYFNLGGLQRFMQKSEESVENYERVISLNPDINYLLGTLVHSKMHLCKWNDLPHELPELIKKINNGKKTSNPWIILSLIDDLSVIKKCAEIYSNDKYSKPSIFHKTLPYHGHKKIRIGYFSPDFNMNPVGNLTAELYEIHDRTNFEIHAFSFGFDTEDDEVKNRIKLGVDHFHEVGKMTNNDVVKLARSLEIDIAIDLAGFTSHHRTEIFAMSAAPIQVSYLGYCGTMGSDFINYIIADRIVVPENQKQHYSENIVYLPNSYIPNNSKVKISKKNFKRADFGLPTEGFIFCCFNNQYKINPITFSKWMKILSKVDGSVLWLSSAQSTAITNLKKEAKKKGIDKNRLIFSTHLHLKEDHLSRIKLADLFLDTLPFNAHATAIDALRVGLPVLTCTGNAFAGRVASSLLNAVNLPEMITTTEEQYVSLAIDLAKNPKKLKTIKDKLVNNLPTAPLFNAQLFASHLEEAYQIMYDRNQKGLNLDDIEID